MEGSKNRFSNAAFLVAVAMIMLFFSLSYIFVPERSFSQEENRALQTAPRFTVKKLLDGTYTAQLHSYLSDQIALRTELVELKAITELAAGKRENNGVLLGKDGYLIETCNYTDENYSYLKSNLARVEGLSEDLAQSNIEAFSVLIPRKVDILSAKLPQYYSTERNEYVWEIVGRKHTDLRDALARAQNEGGEVFYKTDHHWTADGAYAAYVELGSLLGYTPYPREHFDEITLSDSFLGTTYSTSGFFFVGADTIIAPSASTEKYRVEIVDTGRILDGMYDLSYLDVKDKYSTFLSGNNAHVSITLQNGEGNKSENESKNREKLLVIKDSYAHSLAPYLAEHYDLELVDPRYYTGSIESLAVSLGADKALFLLGLDTLASANISIR